MRSITRALYYITGGLLLLTVLDAFLLGSRLGIPWWGWIMTLGVALALDFLGGKDDRFD